MSTNDEFESLIRNFKLDDMEPPPGSGAAGRRAFDFDREEQQIGRASCRERVCQYV